VGENKNDPRVHIALVPEPLIQPFQRFYLVGGRYFVRWFFTVLEQRVKLLKLVIHNFPENI
jgi:hypothetical protein